MTGLLHRRSFLRGIGTTLIAAPAIVRASSIMPVRAIPVSLSWLSKELHIPDPIRVLNLDMAMRHYINLNNFPSECIFTEAEIASCRQP